MDAPVGVGTRTEQSTALRTWLWLAAILLGGTQAWMSRYTLSTHDSVSYLDIADAYLRADWHAALNAHWSPLYSWLLALTLGVLKPTPYWELAAVKALNFLIYLGALVAFDFFLRALVAHNHRQFERDNRDRFLSVPDWVWIVSGYSLFIWSALRWTTLYSDTPDLCTAMFVYLAAGILLRAPSGADGWLTFLLLGVVLALAYFSKTALLPISAAFLVAAMFSANSLRRAFPRVLLAGLTLALVSAPFIAALSAKEGRFTFGEAGRYVYATFVNPGFPVVDLLHWQGDEPEFGTPTHTTRQVHESPAVFEFSTPIAGSYPPWYDPSYWHAGIKTRFDLAQQTKVLVRNLLFAWTTFLAALVFGYLALVIGGDRVRHSLAALKANVVVLIPAAAGVLVYLVATDLPKSDIPTQPAMRYIAPFVVLLFAGVFSSVRLRDTEESRHWLTGVTLAAVTVVGASLVASLAWDRITTSRIHWEHVDWKIAAGLADLGIGPGDAVANLGSSETLYWARLAKVRIVAEIPGNTSETDFWTQPAQARVDALRAIQRTGAKAVVAGSRRPRPASAMGEGWQRIADRDVYVYLFNKGSAAR